MEYLIHFCLEAVGGLGCACAQRFCRHRMHRAVTWGAFSVISTIATVQLVG